MIKCQYFKIRTKDYIKHTYCTHFKAQIEAKQCKECTLYSIKEKPTKTNKNTIKTKARKNKQKLPDSKRFSILTDDLTSCIECGRSKDDLHEIFFGVRNREKSKLLGLVIPLCYYHHNTNLKTSIHNNREFDLKWKELGQQAFIDTYGLTDEDFTKTFGRNYL